MSADDDRFLTMRELMALARYSRPSIYRLIAKDPTFPSPLKLAGGGKVLFARADVESWLASRQKSKMSVE